MSRALIVIALTVSTFGCSTLTALEPPEVTRAGEVVPTTNATFEALGLTVTNLATDLDTPWDLTWGPDGWIWFTERPGNVSRVNPATGELREVARVPSLERGESGLMGIELHPDFPATPYVYLLQSYEANGGIANRLIRYTYENDTFTNEMVLIDSILGNTYHDGARIALGPDGYLYITTGDAGRATIAQDRSSLNGKVLRVTLDGAPAPGNPFGNEVFSYGHRNAQGLVFHPTNGFLYITEHGPRDNDEVAIVRQGENHGWPQVHGFCDNDISGERGFCAENDVTEPLAAWTPTIAPAGADFYDSDTISGWNGSLLFTTLKGSALVRLAFDATGERVVQQQVLSEGVYGRLRDVLVGSDGIIYVATSNRDGRGRPRRFDDRILAIRP